MIGYHIQLETHIFIIIKFLLPKCFGKILQVFSFIYNKKILIYVLESDLVYSCFSKMLSDVSLRRSSEYRLGISYDANQFIVFPLSNFEVSSGKRNQLSLYCAGCSNVVALICTTLLSVHYEIWPYCILFHVIQYKKQMYYTAVCISSLYEYLLCMYHLSCRLRTQYSYYEIYDVTYMCSSSSIDHILKQ